MEEMTRKQPDVDKVTKTYKRKPSETSSTLAERRGVRKCLLSYASVLYIFTCLNEAQCVLGNICVR